LSIEPEGKESKGHNKSLMFSEIKIDPVDAKTKTKILEWLIEDIKLLKHNDKLIDHLPMFCKNGVFFFDLINRLNGKHPILKGVE